MTPASTAWRGRAAGLGAGVLALAALVGCGSLAPRFERPALPVADAFPPAPSVGAEIGRAHV